STLRGCPALSAALRCRTSRRAAAPRDRHRVVPGRVCGRTDVGCAVSRTGSSARLSGVWNDDGSAVVGSAVDCRGCDHPLGAAGARSCTALTADTLGKKTARRIRAEGPLTVAAY